MPPSIRPVAKFTALSEVAGWTEEKERSLHTLP